ncbi:LssY-like putative type I secretion system component LssY [Chthoniobacter flavus]|uniref:LssY C-terminal domain-containing protein n=1 Tax=Chthoniobacter flavus TaxID=191863 RepID=UPI001052D8A5|nr:LssY C-terminal domain-containing protein [Chthoniobacter flavus]TCO93948.1 LssY-like putative type I secretion system component LssY [Chthoniobacter flavus]
MARPLTRFIERFGDWLIGLLAVWVVIAYLALPVWWKRHEAKHPALIDAPYITETGAHIPGDPLNLSVIGAEDDLRSALGAAGWYAPDSITIRSSLHIAASTIFHRPYLDAPVSNLFLFGRKEDLAFEKPAGRDPRERHHVRFWKAPQLDEQGRPCWFGAATFDRSVGLSHTTGQITHHIAADIDMERDGLVVDLQRVNRVQSLDWKNDFQPQPDGRNGGGDPWHTDQRMAVVTLKAGLATVAGQMEGVAPSAPHLPASH